MTIIFLSPGAILACCAAPADLPRGEAWSAPADLMVACGVERFSGLHARFGAAITARAREGKRELLTADGL